MSAVQQMASVGAQANLHKDSSHNAVIQSMTPDALLACGKEWVCVPYSFVMLQSESLNISGHLSCGFAYSLADCLQLHLVYKSLFMAVNTLNMPLPG